MAFENLNLEPSNEPVGEKLERQEVIDAAQKTGNLQAKIEGMKELKDPSLKYKLAHDRQLQADVWKFIQDAGNNALRNTMSQFNARKFDTDKERGLDRFEFEQFMDALDGAVGQIILLDGVKKFESVHNEAAESGGWSSPDKWAASKVDLQEHVLGDEKKGTFTAQGLKKLGLTDQQFTQMEEKPFALTSKESWKDLGILLTKELGEGVEDTLRFLGNVPAAVILLPRYLSGRVDALSAEVREATEAQIKLQALTEDNPALAIADLVGPKGIDMLKQLGSMLVSGKTGDIAKTVVTLATLVTGGAAAFKVGSKLARKAAVTQARKAGRMARTAEAATLNTRAARNTLKAAAKKAENVQAKADKVDDIMTGGAGIVIGHTVQALGRKGATPPNAPKKQNSKASQLEEETVQQPDEETLRTNANLSDKARIQKAEQLLKRTLTPKQEEALIKAHNYGSDRPGQYSQGEFTAKGKILMTAGFTRKEAQLLMDHGVAGLWDKIKATINPGAKEPPAREASLANPAKVDDISEKLKALKPGDTIVLDNGATTEILKINGDQIQIRVTNPGRRPIELWADAQKLKNMSGSIAEIQSAAPKPSTAKHEIVEPKSNEPQRTPADLLKTQQILEELDFLDDGDVILFKDGHTVEIISMDEYTDEMWVKTTRPGGRTTEGYMNREALKQDADKIKDIGKQTTPTPTEKLSPNVEIHDINNQKVENELLIDPAGPIEIRDKNGAFVGNLIKDPSGDFWINHPPRPGLKIPNDGTAFMWGRSRAPELLGTISREHVAFVREGDKIRIINPTKIIGKSNSGIFISGKTREVGTPQHIEPGKVSPTKIETKPEKAPKILDGGSAENLAASMRTYETRSGDKIVAGTDKGVNYGKPVNEDRMFVDPDSGLIAAIDGMGGEGDGHVAAQIIAEELQKSPDDVDKALENAVARIEEECTTKSAGATIAGGKIVTREGQKIFEGFSAGDAKFVVYDRNGNIKGISKDDSLVQSMVDEGKITPEQALYHKFRNVVKASIMKGPKNTTRKYTIPLEKGDRIVLMSDGIADNLTPDEIWEQIEGKTPEEGLQTISNVTDERMRNRDDILDQTGDRSRVSRYSDGFRSEPKRDNRAFAIVDIH